MNTFAKALLTALSLVFVSCASPDEDSALATSAGAPLLEGLGDYHREISTAEPAAQRYFNQGMVLAFGFNHAEAIRSFRAAQRLDPQCAMCFWGEALATGPNINVTSNGKAIMTPEAQQAAYAALQQALALADTVTQQERDLIQAQASRYGASPVTDRAPLDVAYASAMGELRDKYPDDDDIAALFAEAWMNTMPWNYWSDGETPRPETVPVIQALESIIERNPTHPLALHLYIHAVEASSDPGRAEQEADTLARLVPGSGHLVHMPAHIYWRVGRYHDAAEANVRAAAVDEAYIAQCNVQGFYPALYYPHNIHFLWAASSMEGRSAVAIDAARKVAANVRLEQIEEFPAVEFFHTIPLLALVQFGHWEELLAEPAPATTLAYSTAIWHYARGTALAKLGDLDAARQEQTALQALKDNDKVLVLNGNDYPASALLDIADALLQGELALASGDADGAASYFAQAVATQDALPYMEPPFWYYPSRQSLGLALLQAGRPAEAEAVYRQDLERFPHNGWSTYGLIQSLEAQQKRAEASEHRAHFEQMWALADVELEASRL